MSSWVGKLLGWTDQSTVDHAVNKDDDVITGPAPGTVDSGEPDPISEFDPAIDQSEHLITNTHDDIMVEDDNACCASVDVDDGISGVSKIEGLRFFSFEEGLLPYFSDIAVKEGFVLAKSTFRMDEVRALELFGKEDIIQRGFLYCRGGGADRQKCAYKIPFTFVFQDKSS
jgi:hypothetical protein